MALGRSLLVATRESDLEPRGRRVTHRNSLFIAAWILSLFACGGSAQTKTWDSRHDTSHIALKVVYFVPKDRPPLPDWRDRAEYYCRRLDLFHQREFQGQSQLDIELREEPFVSALSTAELREGDANAIFYRTLQEVDEQVGVSRFEGEAFPILLVLSEINWRPLDDFYRLKPADGRWEFEGNYHRQEHFPGATSGGARATFMTRPGAGWGLVSADGWRVPYRGSDCVIYHEGLGHTVGLPHPEPGNPSVMSMGQYNGWLSESWIDDDQKERLSWKRDEAFVPSAQLQLYSAFRALPEPRVPQPDQNVVLKLDWPEGAEVQSLRVRYQTAIDGPWIEVPQILNQAAPTIANLCPFERETPVSYRVDATTSDGSTAEIWGYFQVRADRERAPLPFTPSIDLRADDEVTERNVVDRRLPLREVDLLAKLSVEECWQRGEWSIEDGKLLSPKQYGARLEIPYSLPTAYRMVMIIEPLDEPNGLLMGLRSGDHRFAALFQYRTGEQVLSAIENVRGRNVGNETTYEGALLAQNRLAQVVTKVTPDSIEMSLDGRVIASWQGDSTTLSLSDYWSTPNDRALFIGAYDCRYLIHRLTIEELDGAGEWMIEGQE